VFRRRHKAFSDKEILRILSDRCEATSRVASEVSNIIERADKRRGDVLSIELESSLYFKCAGQLF